MRRGYCAKAKQEWPDSGSTLENLFCNFYEINSSQDFFCIAKVLVLMVVSQRGYRTHSFQLADFALEEPMLQKFNEPPFIVRSPVDFPRDGDRACH